MLPLFTPATIVGVSVTLAPVDGDRVGQRGNRLLQQLGRAVIVALVQRVDGAEVAAQAQLDGIAGRHRFGLGKQPLGLAKLAEVRALQRAVQGEFGRIDVGGGLVALRAARQCFEKFGGFGIIAAVVAPVSLGQCLIDVDRPGQRAGETVVGADRCRRDLDDAGDDLALADRFEREVERVAIGGEALDRVRRIAVTLDPRLPYDAAVLDRAGSVGGAGDGVGAAALDPRFGGVGAGAQHADISDRLAGIAAQDHPGAVEHAVDDGIAHRGLYGAQRTALIADRKTVAQCGVGALRLRGSGRRESERRQNRQAKRTSNGHHQSPKHKARGALPTQLRQGAVFIAAVRPIPLIPTLIPSRIKGK